MSPAETVRQPGRVTIPAPDGLTCAASWRTWGGDIGRCRHPGVTVSVFFSHGEGTSAAWCADHGSEETDAEATRRLRRQARHSSMVRAAILAGERERSGFRLP